MLRRLHDRYRASGADLPFGNPLRAHGLAMEGYFWRFTERLPGSSGTSAGGSSGARPRVLVALIGVNRSGSGPWATLGLASSAGFLRVAEPGSAWAATDRLAAGSGAAFTGEHDRVRVDLGDDARVDVRIAAPAPWPRRAFGGSSVFGSVPGLNQYWHPWLLGGRASGTAVVGGSVWELDGWDAYGEKNWGREGFPEHWWWGQAQGFDGPAGGADACVAFAGGEVTAGPLRTTVTALVVRLPEGRVLRLGDPVVSPVRARVDDETWQLDGRIGGWRVSVTGQAPLADAHVLPAPLPSERRNTAGALEHLSGRLTVEVRRGRREVWSGTSLAAGLEHGGLARTEAELRRRGHPVGTVAAGPHAAPNPSN